MKIITDKFVFGGKSLGKIDSKNVFVPYGIPGEELEINITESKRDYDNAEIIEILKPSEHRKNPECKYYGKCGGCNMMHIDSEYQKELRCGMLKDMFMQNGIKLPEQIAVISGPDFNYRSRFQFTDGGLSERSSNNIVPINECLCAEKPVNAYLKKTPFNERNSGRCHFFGSDFISIIGGSTTGKTEFSSSDEKILIAKEDENNIRNIKTKTIGKSKKNIKIRENHYFAGTVLSQNNSVTVNLNGKNITFDVRGFFQSNLFVFEKVLKLICNSLPAGKNVLDMYAGCGSISSFLADKFENVVLVEHNRDALVYAEQNLAGKKHVSYGFSGADWVKNSSAFCGQFDACVVDPPRSGMEKEVRDYLCKSKIPFIVSLSCDPSTQSRDIKALLASGYNLDKIYLLDFYPNTSHIESLAVLSLNI